MVWPRYLPDLDTCLIHLMLNASFEVAEATSEAEVLAIIRLSAP
jgi:hypothetical protein